MTHLSERVLAVGVADDEGFVCLDVLFFIINKSVSEKMQDDVNLIHLDRIEGKAYEATADER